LCTLSPTEQEGDCHRWGTLFTLSRRETVTVVHILLIPQRGDCHRCAHTPHTREAYPVLFSPSYTREAYPGVIPCSHIPERHTRVVFPVNLIPERHTRVLFPVLYLPERHTRVLFLGYNLPRGIPGCYSWLYTPREAYPGVIPCY